MARKKTRRETRGECDPCEDFEEYKPPTPQPYKGKKEKLPKTLQEMEKAFKHLNARLDDWHDWAVGVNDTLTLLTRYVYRLEHAVCCLEGHVIHGKGRPAEGLICDQDGEFEAGTLHDQVTGPWPITDPPDEPWE